MFASGAGAGTEASTARLLRQAATVLVVEAQAALPLLDPGPDRQSVVFAPLRLLRAETLAQLRPDAVVAPLIGSNWDILDLGLALEEAGYRGGLFVLTRPLPRADLVLNELRGLCPGLDIRLLTSP